MSEPRRLAAMLTFVALLHAIGLGALLAPDGTVTVGVGLTAYTLGIRHAFDADHIAAIDSTTRKLMGDGQRPLGAGLFFSLGHSTVVLGLAALFAFGATALAGPVRDDNSALHAVTGTVGASVSGAFLYVIALGNLVVLFGAARRREAPPVAGGILSRLLARVTGSVRATWQLYPLGILFGLGFDTATEIGLLVLAAGAAGAGLSWVAVLSLPILFAAGMALFDTLDGAMMRVAYGWAADRPRHRHAYNITMTSLSVVAALAIGTVQLLGALGVAEIDLAAVGYALVGLFAATWAVALAVWRTSRAPIRL